MRLHCGAVRHRGNNHTPVASHSLAISRSIAVIECPTGRTRCVTVAPARVRPSAKRAPSPGDRRASSSPSMVSTGVPRRRVGSSSRKGERGRNRTAPASRRGSWRDPSGSMSRCLLGRKYKRMQAASSSASAFATWSTLRRGTARSSHYPTTYR